MVNNHRDMKGVDARRSRQNRFPEYFFGDFQDRLLDRQDRDTRQRLEAALSEGGTPSAASSSTYCEATSS